MPHTGTPPRFSLAWRRTVFGVCLLVSVVVLFTPATDVPAGPRDIDKVIHVLLFAVLTVTGRRAGVRWSVLLPALVAYAAASEPLQSLPGIGRSTSLADWVADVAGVLLGYSGVVASTRFRSASRSRSGSG
ncbi:MAG: VanZ family protein [Mycobacterium sp.]|nr:VanZ family protein [Mycobacterium sp.]